MESYIISMFKQLANMTSGEQKKFIDWKIANANIVKCVKTSDIQRRYPEIDYYIKTNKRNIKKKECFKNAGKLCTEIEGVYYVEGEVSLYGVPIKHAWNRIDDKYFDVTIDFIFNNSLPFNEYVKIIEMHTKEYMKFLIEYKHWGGFVSEKYIKDRISFHPKLSENLMADNYYKALGINTSSNNKVKYDYNIVAQINDTYIVKNPSSLNEFDSNVRAIADRNGNLYVAMNDGFFNHGDIADALILKKQIVCPLYDYTLDKRKDREEGGIYSRQKEFLILNRCIDSNIFIQSDSTVWEGEYSERIIRRVKEKNPQFSIHISFIH